MSKAIVEKVAESFSLTKKLAGEVVQTVLEGLIEEITTAEKTRITGLGTFSKVEKAERDGRNPASGETIRIPAKTTIKFKAAPALKKAL